ncbi:MAG: U32 family peptidase [Gammaproteobacteria bacterium]|nr:U32 family peptidase [Gammaproteobacteria bacterium]
MKISVASVPYYWSKEAYYSFYESLAKLPVDIVYLGETVCSKRRTMKFEDWLAIAKLLTAVGKQVVLSTMTLIEAESELGYLTKIAQQNEYLIEANELAALQVAQTQGKAFVVGSPINVYNNRSISIFNKLGMIRWCMPVELGRDDLAPMIKVAKGLDIEVEYQVFGRMSLAYSARCFTARHHRLPKDNCEFKCLEDEQGILVNTQEGDAFAQINGIQTQSAKVNHLLDQWQKLEAAGIDILRIVPVSAADTLTVVKALSKALTENSKDIDLEGLTTNYEYCNGYWFQEEGMKFLG